MNTYVKKGEISKTENQVKKHYSDFTIREISILRAVLNGMEVTPSPHLVEKKLVQKVHVKNVFKSFDIIEFNHTVLDCHHPSYNPSGDSRVLIRGKAVEWLEDSREYNLCLVISLTRADIVTGYYNLVEDKHERGFNKNRYTDFDILEYL